MQSYPLEPFSIGDDRYIVISKGHHDIHAFMKAVREDVADSRPLGVPIHTWMKTTPPPPGSGYRAWYSPCTKETRGAWPCTYAHEAYNEDRYEAKFPKETT